MSMNDIISCFWKESPDSYGAEAVVNEAKQGDTVISHCVQLKLGKSLTNADAEGIVEQISYSCANYCGRVQIVWNNCVRTKVVSSHYTSTCTR